MTQANHPPPADTAPIALPEGAGTASPADAVMPMEPVAFSAIVLAATLLSTGVVTANSLTSVTAKVKACTELEPSAEVALT